MLSSLFDGATLCIHFASLLVASKGMNYYRTMRFLALVLLVGVPIACVSAAGGRCQGDEYYVIPDGRDYRGSVNTTSTGIPCQSWASQSPHPHDTVVPNPSMGIGFNNYCRNPFMDSTVGCFTTDPNVRYQLCDIGPPCTAATSAPRSIVVLPSNGTRVAFGTYATMSCTPTPCDIYFTNGSTTPTKQSKFYGHPIALLTNQTLSAVAYYADGSVLYTSSTIQVAAQEFSASFFPLPGYYTTPILLFAVINGSVQQSSMVLIVGDQTLPFNGNGTWLSATGDVSVVRDNTLLTTGHYVFQLPSPLPPTVYPQSGTYWGGVNILVFPLPRIKTLLFALNNSAMSPLIGSTLSIHAHGVTTLHLVAEYFDGTSAASTFQYNVLLAWAPQCSPPPGTYTVAINISCDAPRGGLASITVAASPPSDALYLSTPGVYDVTASYVDDSFSSINATLQYTLVAAAVNMPSASPCGTSAVGNEAVVAMTIPSNTTLSMVVSNGSALQRDDRTVVLSGGCLSPTQVCLVTSFLTATPVGNPMLRSSNATPCSVALYPRGTMTTASYRVHSPIDGSVLARCLLFGNAELVDISEVGPYSIARVTQLPASLVTQYDLSLASCLSQQVGDGEVLRNGTFSLVTRYTSTSSSITTRSSVALQLFGWDVQASFSKLVLVSMPCTDVGIPIIVQKDLSAVFAPTESISHGMYRVCAVTDGNAYSVQGPIINVLPFSRTASVVPCGGVLDAVFTAVTINNNDGTMVSINGGRWQSLATLTLNAVDAPTVVSAVNGDDFKQCVFRPATAPPANATYRLTPLSGGGVVLSLSARVSPSAALEVSVRSSNCSTTQTFTATAMSVADTIVVDDAVFAGVVPTNATVCLTDGLWTIQASPSNIALTQDAFQLVGCNDCATGLCFRNGSCVCVGAAKEAIVCTTASGTDAADGTLTVLRLILLIVYVFVVLGVWIAVRRHALQAKESGN